MTENVVGGLTLRHFVNFWHGIDHESSTPPFTATQLTREQAANTAREREHRLFPSWEYVFCTITSPLPVPSRTASFYRRRFCETRAPAASTAAQFSGSPTSISSSTADTAASRRTRSCAACRTQREALVPAIGHRGPGGNANSHYAGISGKVVYFL